MDKSKELLEEFLNRWTIDDVKELTLEKYVGVGNKDTFCQWVETKTRMLGSIKGMTSIKFGIYERKDSNQKPKNYRNDEKYSWLKIRGKSRENAFKQIKKQILEIIEYSGLGKFDKIDSFLLPDLFKWKIAFLYSNERLIPIYKREVLFKIANHYGLQTTKHTKVSEIQNIMMTNKPANLNVFQFMWQLYDQFGSNKEKDELSANKEKEIATRKATKSRNIIEQTRTISSKSFIVSQIHNKIQEKLKNQLIKKYGHKNVLMEENFVDIKLLQPNYISFYEVKSSSYASQCVKEALGQILLYSHNDNDERQKKHFVVGQYPATENDKKYIKFIKDNLKLEFDYINIEID